MFGQAVYGTIATTAGRRLIFIRYANKGQNPGQRVSRVCAEPPPDAIDALANRISASGSGGNGTATAKAQLARSFAVSSGLGLYRSQGLELLRDEEFQLCMRDMEDPMSNRLWLKHDNKIMRTASKLIQEEMKAIKAYDSRPTMIVKAPNLSSTSTKPNTSSNTHTGAASHSSTSGGTSSTS